MILTILFQLCLLAAEDCDNRIASFQASRKTFVQVWVPKQSVTKGLSENMYETRFSNAGTSLEKKRYLQLHWIVVLDR